MRCWRLAEPAFAFLLLVSWRWQDEGFCGKWRDRGGRLIEKRSHKD